MNAPALRRWLATRRDDWGRIERALRGPLPRRQDEAEALQQIADYRALARDLAVARRELPGTELIPRLETALRQSHLRLHRRREPLRVRLRRLYLQEIPQQFQQLRTALAVVVALFVGSALASALLVWFFPELAALVASEQMIDKVQRGGLWTDDVLNVVPSSVMSARIISNNVTVALMAFVFGTLYGAGTVYIVMLNGAMLGGVFALTAHYGLAERLFKFIIAHGVVELSVILLTAAAGVSLGEALVRPGDRTRSVAFGEAVAGSGRLLFVIVPFLLLAGIIEAYVSPAEVYGMPERLLVGLLSGGLLWAVLSGRAWRRWQH